MSFIQLYFLMIVVTVLGVVVCMMNLVGAVRDYRHSLRGGSPLKKSITWAYVRGGIVITITVALLFLFAALILTVRLQERPLGRVWANVAVSFVVLAAVTPTVGALLAFRSRQRIKKLVEPPKVS